jgi:putative ABC transport system permease protein
MTWIDLLRLIVGNLSRRKGRVALTAIGVIIGTAAVVILVSLAIGLQENANQQLYGIGDLTQITVMPTYPEMSMVEAGGGKGGGGSADPKLLTNQAVDELRALPHVVAVIPHEYYYGGMIVQFDKMEAGFGVTGVATDDLSNLGLEITQGTTALAKGTMVIGPQIPMNFYNPHLRPGQEPPPPPDLYDQKLKVILIKWDNEGKEIRKTVTYKVTGVLKENRGQSDWSVYMPLEDVKAMNEWMSGQRINYNKNGYSQVIVKVDEVSNVLSVTDQITTLGFQAYTPQSFVEGINNFYVVLQVIFGGVGAIALLVAAIGIANTMAMAILERTREIGLMKAIGATNRDVLSIFLGEAAGIGFVGGLGGVIIGWLSGQAINVVALVYMANQTASTGGAPPSIAVSTPFWLPLFALVFATIIGLLSGLYPALRAATMIPVLALKYE